MRQLINKPHAALLTTAATTQMDKLAVAHGKTVGELMARAGAGVAHAITRRWPGTPVAVVCGPGNNGGDGYIAACELKAAGHAVRVCALTAPTTDACRDAAARWHATGEDVGTLDESTAARLGQMDGVLVDALFGAGLSRPLAGPAATLAQEVREHGRRVVSVDVPSGLNGDNGRVLQGVAFQAELTVTFERARPGHFLAVGGLLCGTVEVVPIGMPDDVVAEACRTATVFQNQPSIWAATVAKVNPLQHKYDYGHAIVCGGPPNHGGAARLAAGAALRAGAGLVTVVVEPAAAAENAAQLNAVMLREVQNHAEFIALLQDYRISALLIGPGAGVNRRLRSLVTGVLGSEAYRNRELAVVLDADALTVFEARSEELFARLRGGNAVLTPHAGEFGRLFPDLAKALSAGKRSGPDVVCEAAARSHATILYKGACSIIAHPQGECWLNAATGDAAAPWLATAGAGDVLAGLIVGFMARGIDPLEASGMAAWIHATVGRQFGAGLTADDIDRSLPAAIAMAIDQQD